jgi:hypothetical protein
MTNNSDDLNTPADGGEPSGEAIGTGNDERLARLSSIADQADRDREDELANINDDGTTEPFKAERDEEEAPVEEEAAPAEEAPAEEAPTEADEERTYTIKVNGKELRLTEAELIARAQKVESADDYLREAAAAKRQPVEPAGPSPEEIQRQRDADDRALVRAIQMGTEEEATAALRKMREQPNARPSLSADDVSRVIDERLEFTEAVKRFRNEFAEIDSDPFLKKLALDKDQELIDAGDRRAYWERYQEIGTSLQAWKNSLAPKAVDKPAENTFADKEQRKAAAPKAPMAASAKQKPVVQQDDDDEPSSSVIASMAKSRGGPQWMRN